MSIHEFLRHGRVNDSDVRKIVELVRAGTMRWYHSGTHAAINVAPRSQVVMDDIDVLHDVIGKNLHGCRIGYNPTTMKPHYIRLKDEDGEYHYLEGVPLEALLLDFGKVFPELEVKR